MSTHKFTEQDKTEQGQKAIAFGIQNKNSTDTYDYTTQESADFSWPDLDTDDIGQLEPWLCYREKPDGTQGGWTDLNAIADGKERKLTACGSKLGFPEELGEDVDAAKKIIESINGASDFDSAAGDAGFKSNDQFSLKDHVASASFQLDEALEEGYANSDELLKEQKEKTDAEMDDNIAAAQSGGLLDPIDGIDMETWAAGNAKITNGMPLEDVLKVVGTEKPLWDNASAIWMERMSQDTTFAITKVYGDAFTNSDIGKFASSGGAEKVSTPAAASGGASGAGNAMEDFDLYIKIMCHQNMGAQQGKDAQSILSEYDLTVTDWGNIGMHWNTQMATDTKLAMDMVKLMEKYNAEFASGSAGDGIDF